MMDNGVAIEIIGDHYHLTHVIVKRLHTNAVPLMRNRIVLQRNIIKYLGKNKAAVQVLLGSKV